MNKLDAEEFTQKFKAISVKAGRRGIKLEQLYWKVLEEIAAETNSTIGSIVDAAEANYPEQKNLTSTLRVICLSEIKQQLSRVQSITGEDFTKNLVSACPIPTLALSTDKRLYSFNEPFLRYIQKQFSVSTVQKLPSKLKLILDVQIDVLIQALTENGNQRILVGIAIGVDNRRVRSQLNVCLAPLINQNVIIGYLLP